MGYSSSSCFTFDGSAYLYFYLVIVIVGVMWYCKRKRQFEQDTNSQIEKQLEGQAVEMNFRNPMI
jgi:hypothetical protein